MTGTSGVDADAFESFLGEKRLLFRAITPDDKQRIRDGLERLSPESRYRRFFRHIDHLSEKELDYLTEVDFVDHVAWMVVLPDVPGQPGIAVGRWIRVPGEPEVAEAAVTVIDDYQGNGIGKTLLWLLARSAAARRVRSFRAWVLGENRAILGVLAELGAQGKWESGVYVVDVPIPEVPGDLHTSVAPLVLHAVATGRLVGEARSQGGRGTRLLPSG